MSANMLYMAFAILAVNLVLVFRMVRAFGLRWWGLLVTLWCLAIPFWFPAYRYAPALKNYRTEIAFAGNIWIAICVFIVMGFLGTDFLRLICQLCSKVRKRKNPFTRKRAFCFAMLLACLLTVYSFYEATTLTVRQYSISSPKTPKAKPFYRAIFVTDIHLGEFIGAKRLQEITDRIKSLEPDFFFMDGDIVDGSMRGKDTEAALIASVRPSYGTYTVLGNHEAMHGAQNAMQFFEAAKVRVLRGEGIKVAGFTLIGLDDPLVSDLAGEKRHTLPPVLAKQKHSGFTIVLKHRPAFDAASLGLFDLQLSGHTHGGQIWPLNYVMQRFFKTPQQEFTRLNGKNGNSHYYTSSGTGYWRMPMRFLTPPEIVVVDIFREQ